MTLTNQPTEKFDWPDIIEKSRKLAQMKLLHFFGEIFRCFSKDKVWRKWDRNVPVLVKRLIARKLI